MAEYDLDPEPLSVQLYQGQLIAVSVPSRATRRLVSLDVNGPTGSTAVVMVTPTSVPDPSRVINRTRVGDGNTYTPSRSVSLPQSWRVIVAWTGGIRTNVETATLYATEVTSDD